MNGLPQHIFSSGVGVILACAPAFAQPTALDTFGPNNSYDTTSALAVRGSAATMTTVGQATLFTAQATGPVEQITTVLRHESGANTYTVQLRTGNVNQVGPALGSWSVEGGSIAEPIINISVGGAVTLNEGTTYYITAIGHGSATGLWFQNNQGMVTNGWATSSNEGITFFLVNGTRLPAVRITLEGDPPCYANCDGSTGEPILTVDDFTCFINEFAAAQGLPHEQQVVHYANCDGSTTAPVLTVDDFTCFINAFAAGCP